MGPTEKSLNCSATFLPCLPRQMLTATRSARAWCPDFRFVHDRARCNHIGVAADYAVEWFPKFVSATEPSPRLF
jgi:hypothetical protein